VTRRQWLLQLGEGAALIGWSGIDLSAAEFPPGVYLASREHLAHALAGHPTLAGGETELVELRAAGFQPAFFSTEQYRAILQLTGLLLGEAPEAPVVREIAEWIDLTVSEAAAIRAAARALSPAHRTLAVHHYGADAVRKLEDFDAQQVMREGLEWLDAEGRRRYGRAFQPLENAEQVAILQTLSENPATGHAGTRLFVYMKERVVHGFYTSRAGLEELGYRGNAYYVSPPGCEHLYG